MLHFPTVTTAPRHRSQQRVLRTVKKECFWKFGSASHVEVNVGRRRWRRELDRGFTLATWDTGWCSTGTNDHPHEIWGPRQRGGGGWEWHRPAGSISISLLMVRRIVIGGARSKRTCSRRRHSHVQTSFTGRRDPALSCSGIRRSRGSLVFASARRCCS